MSERSRPLDAGRLYLVPLLAALAVLAALSLPLAGGQAILRDDLALFHLPLRYLYARALAHGQSVLWFPELFAGFYVHGEGQLGMLHPLHLILYRTLPLIVAFNFELLLNYVGLFGGTFLFLTRQSLPRTAALFGALVFTFSGFNLMHFVHPNMVGVVAHMPWLLLAIDIVLREKNPRRAAAAQLAIGLLTASQVLLGHPQALWLSSFLEVLYVFFGVPAPRPWSRIWWVALAKVLGVAGGAVQLLPTWEVVLDSARANLPASFTYRHLLDPANLLQLVSPYLARTRVFGSPYPQEATVYCGAVATLVPLWLLLRGRRAECSRLANGALIVGALAAILALGERGYLYRIQANLPLISRFEAAARYIVLLHFALAVGAAVAMRDLLQIVDRRAPLAWSRLSLLAVAPSASLLAAGASMWTRAHPRLLPELARQLAPTGSAFAGVGLLLLASALVAAGARGARHALSAIMLFAALDQGYYGLTFLRQYPSSSPEEFAAAQAPPPDASAHRVESTNNILVMTGAHLADGYAAFAPARFLDPLDGQRLRVAGVKWVQTKAPWRSTEQDGASLPSWEGHVRGRVTTRDVLGGTSLWAEVIDPMPRTWIVSRAIVSADPRRDIGSIDLGSTALVSQALELRSGQPGTAEIVADDPGRIQIVATTESRQLLILSESWHRGWELRVGGVTQPIVRVFGDFMGCVVEAGRHDVQFLFRPWSFRAGAWASFAGFALMFVVFGVARRTGGPTKT